MAKKEEGPKTVLERTYNVPLRRRWMHVPKYKRAKKAVTTLKVFLEKHMKSDNIKLGKYLNDHIWKHGIKNPPHHVKIIAKKDDKGLVTAELEGAPVEEKKETKKKGLAGKVEKAKEAPAVSKKEEEEAGKEKAVKEEKEELEAIKKEKPKEMPEMPKAPKKAVEAKPTAPKQKG
jgi:large subunit ribosomal protein L31e